MKTILVTILAILVVSCRSSKPDLTRRAFQLRINAVEKSNIENGRLANGWYETAESENDFKRIYRKTSVSYFINPKPLILPENFVKWKEFENREGTKGLAVYFDKIGIEMWSKATDKNLDSHLIFIFDNEILTAPHVKAQIKNGASSFWKNDLTENQWNEIKGMMKK